MTRRTTILAGALALAAAASAPRVASAQNWTEQRFRVSVGSVDFNGSPDGNSTGCCSGLQTGWVQNVLGAGGFPVLSMSGAAYTGANRIRSVAAGQELQWWLVGGMGGTVQSDGVVYRTGASFDTGNNYFAIGQSNNSTFQRTALFTGFAANGGTGSWTVGGDDDTWVFRNGSLVLDNGGVKGFGTTTTSSVTWAAGDRIEIFFADRNTVQSRLAFRADGLELTTVPEPSTYALMGAGLLGLAGVARRRRPTA